MRRLAPAAAFLLLFATLARAQSRYDMYGDPIDVTVQNLADLASSYDGKAVRVKAKFELATNISQRGYMLRDGMMAQVLIYPVQDIAARFEDEALKLSGREIEITGVFQENKNIASNPGMGVVAGAIMFWEYIGPPEEVKGDIKANLVSLESLVGGNGRYDGKTIRIYGRFRGKNLYGDLPSRSQRQSRDWVLKDELFAVWITGRKPKGSGFELDPNLRRDTEKWLQVVGIPETIKGVTYLRAMQVTLGKPAESAVASASTGPAVAPTPAPLPTPPPPPKPPVVVFALPLDGEPDVPSNGRFQIQFSNDMDEASFKGRVVLRYAPPVRPGDRDFDGAKMTYDGGRKALTVEPGDVLRPGREVQILLLPGIVDIEGTGLEARPGRDTGPLGAIDFLRYSVVAASLMGAR